MGCLVRDPELSAIIVVIALAGVVAAIILAAL